MRKSEILKIIREEVEVVLTNEEAEEMFDLDMSALLDEMMSEAESDAGSDFLKSKGHDPETAAPFKGTKTKRGAAKHQRRKEKSVGKEIEELEEDDDKWMQKAFSKNKGGLHRALDVPKGKDISVSKMATGLRAGGKKEKMARAAVNANPDKYSSIKDVGVEKKKKG